ncbi:prephenate dehydrogenase [Xylella fastidiosa]|uniref:prephenate dehydrogenase n=1 Tax=Xylella fastidiosa TaxID=2371 RepID=UPI0007336871|nr:prephenate dehydrogenase [Xylella fastidiosa]
MSASPLVGIVGSAGAYGHWLGRFLRERMGLKVIGYDPADPASLSPAELLRCADVLVFSVPIRQTAALIGEYVAMADGTDAGQLWIDVTSIKQAPVEAMLASQAEVVGLHPMTAPPKAPTLKGRVLVVCEARLHHWRPWLMQLCEALEAECVAATPEHHDRLMALVQAMVHACHLAQAGVLRDYLPLLGEFQSIMSFRSMSFELDMAMIARILSLNPSIYEDIQFGNSYVLEMLDHLLSHLLELRALVSCGDDAARTRFRAGFLEANHQVFPEASLVAGNYNYERIGYLLADLTEPLAFSVYLPEDRPGSLQRLLHVFEEHAINLSSIHSSRTPAGELHFRISFDPGSDHVALMRAADEIDMRRIGCVLTRPEQ